MANSEQRIRKYVADEKRKGTADARIIVGITKLDGQAGKDAQKMVKSLRAADLSPAQEIGAYFGLEYQVDPKATKKNKNATLGDKVKSTNYSVMSGVTKSFGAVAQANNSFVDTLYGGINKVTGSKLPTNNRKKYDADVSKMDARKNQLRDQANYSGMDLGELGGEIAAKAPLYVAGGAPTAGAKGLAAFAGREAVIGGLDGSLRHSKTTAEQVGNTALGAVGGAVGGVVGVAAGKGVGYAGKQVARRGANKSGSTATAATKLVDDAIRDTGIAVKPAARAQLVKQATQNLSKSKQIDAAAAVRKSLLDEHGIKGTQAQLSRNPSDWRAERELAKRNPDLNDVHTGNHEQVKSQWQSMADETGARPVDNNTRMQSTFETLSADDAVRKAGVKSNYDAATNSAGIQTPVNKANVSSSINQQLKDNLLDLNQPNQVGQILKRLDDPDYTMTIGDGEQYIKTINKALKTAFGTGDEPALQIAKKAIQKELDDAGTAIMQQSGDSAAKETVGLLNTARASHGARMADIDANPTLQAAMKDEPVDKAFDKYVLKANERDLVRLIDDLKKTPEGQQNIADLQGSAIEHFLQQASKANDGAFSPAMLNRSIKSFGDNRMKALFTPQQIARLNDIQQVSDVLMQQPLGSHVNHSNTASALINAMLGIAGGLGKIPVLGHGFNIATGGIKTAVDMSSKGASTTAGARAINGRADVTRGSNLGLTDEQLKLLGLMSDSGGKAGAAVGASLGD